MNSDEAEWLGQRGPCEDCGSLRGLAFKTDGSTKCHACGKFRGTGKAPSPRPKDLQGLIPQDSLSIAALPSRGITYKTVEKYRYGICELKGETVQVAQWFDSAGQAVAQKVRRKDKSFHILGDASQMGLFGAHSVKARGKRIMVTEGELDALALSQAFGNSWPVVSLPNGSASAAKALKVSLELLDGYDEVVLAFDMDDPGRKAVEECLPLFEPGKCRVAQYPLKDACDMLKAGRGQELKEAVWNAKAHVPGGILTGDEAWEKAVNEVFERGMPYDFEGLETYLKGLRLKELILITSGTGSGKSTFVRQLTAWVATKYKVGYLGLEESVRQTMLNIYGSVMGVSQLAISEELPMEELAKVHETYRDRIAYLDHFGSTDGEDLLSKIRFMVKGLDCKVIILDHISIAVSGMETTDERKSIDVLITGLRSLVEETGCAMIVISHLRKPKDGSHEEGKPISLNDLRGSQTLAQIPDIILALERDQQAATEETRNTVLGRVLKNRPVGPLGAAMRMKYDNATGRLTEVPLDDVSDDFKVDDEDFS